MGMLAYFVRGFTSSNVLTPDYILTPFIASVLAVAWALGTLFTYHRARHSAFFVAFVDLCFVAAFIASAVALRGIAREDCANFAAGRLYANLGPFGSWGRSWGSAWAANTSKTCAMLKASFAFVVMNCVVWFFTALLALFLHRRYSEREHVREETHVRRHGHRRSSSRHSRQSSRRHHHSSRRPYFV